jgi:hypothetical protein
LKKPKYGDGKDALFTYKGEEFYVYLNSLCKGFYLGPPEERFVKKVIPEFIDIHLDINEKQKFSTSKIFD